MNILILMSFAVWLNPHKSPVADSSIVVPDKYLVQVKRKSDHASAQVDKRTEKTLERFTRQEEKMQAKMMKKDSVLAKQVFGPSIAKLHDMKARLGRKNGKSDAGSPYLDTLQNTLKFMKGADNVKASGAKLASAEQSVDNLQGSLQQAEMVKNCMREQRLLLKAQLANYTGFGSELTKMNKEAYYYGQQVNEYKAALSDKKKAEEKAIKLLKESSQYNDFIKQNTQIAGLFNLIGRSNGVGDISGLQTRSQVEQVLSQRVGNDPAAKSAVSQQLAAAKSQMSELKDKYGNVDNAADMPDFKPNPMKAKRFLQRLEYGGNVQFQKSSVFFPTMGDIAGQVGYKFHKNGTAGVGVGYKLGMGRGWNNIAISHQGVGLRSFIDWKLKGTFFVNGGFEENYMSAISHFSQLSDLSGWQSSVLLGVSKKYKLNGKLKGNMMVLYDFMAERNVPKTSAFKLRFGYTM